MSKYARIFKTVVTLLFAAVLVCSLAFTSACSRSDSKQADTGTATVQETENNRLDAGDSQGDWSGSVDSLDEEAEGSWPDGQDDDLQNSWSDAQEEDVEDSWFDDEFDTDDSTYELDVVENGTYTSKDEVALYIHLFGHLPDNYITKKQARKAGWHGGNPQKVCNGKSIGGDKFYNDDGLLPDKPGRTWKECDVDYSGSKRGAKRIVFSNDGLVFYTSDHYESFEQLY